MLCRTDVRARQKTTLRENRTILGLSLTHTKLKTTVRENRTIVKSSRLSAAKNYGSRKSNSFALLPARFSRKLKTTEQSNRTLFFIHARITIQLRHKSWDTSNIAFCQEFVKLFNSSFASTRGPFHTIFSNKNWQTDSSA